MTPKNNHTFIALTAVWAFVESGLGGMMHALHLPFTGIFLGGFSVLAISMLAHFEPKPFAGIIKATLIVMAVKAGVNPMTSPMAYIAVGFQGLAGALIFSLPFRNMATCMTFALLAMLESAFQKLLIITLIFGKIWLEAIDIYVQSILKLFGVASDSPFSLYAVGFYVLIYFLWGLLLGIWAFRLPGQVEERRGMYDGLVPRESQVQQGRKKRGKKFVVLILSLLLLILSTFLIPDAEDTGKAARLLIRTAAVVGLWVFLVLPLWKRFIERMSKRNRSGEMHVIQDRMREISSLTGPLIRKVSSEYKGIRKWQEIILGLMVISLNSGKRDE